MWIRAQDVTSKWVGLLGMRILQVKQAGKQGRVLVRWGYKSGELQSDSDDQPAASTS